MIAIIGTVGVPACYGGFESLVDNLLDAEGDFTVYCSSKSYDQKMKYYKSAKLVYLPLNANGISSILYDALSILHALIKGHKVLLVLGVSAGLLLPFIRLLTGKRLVTNIDGLEWRRDKWGRLAKWYLKISERAAVRFSHVVIADNQGIADYIMEEYAVSSEVIAYGGDHVLASEPSYRKGDYAFGVCRIEPENNIHVILEAFSKADKNLKFVGNWSASEYGQKLKQQFSSFKNIELIDPIYDLSHLFTLRDGCEFYIHGHSAGGTNPSLVEAMFFGKPILAFDCVYNRATMYGKGSYFTDTANLNSILSSDSLELCDGEEIRTLAESHYTWESIRQSYLDIVDVNSTNH